MADQYQLPLGKATGIGAERARADLRAWQEQHPFLSYLGSLLSGGATDVDFEPGPADLAMAALPLVGKPMSIAERALAAELEPMLARTFGSTGGLSRLEALRAVGAGRPKYQLGRLEEAARAAINKGELSRTVEALPGSGLRIPGAAAETPTDTARRLFEEKARTLGGGTVPEVTASTQKSPHRFDVVERAGGTKRLAGQYIAPTPEDLAEIRRLIPFGPERPPITLAPSADVEIPSAVVNPTVVAVLGGRPRSPQELSLLREGLAKMGEAGTKFRVSAGSSGLETAARQLPPEMRTTYTAGRRTNITEPVQRQWDVTPIESSSAVQSYHITPQQLPPGALDKFKVPGVNVQKSPEFQRALDIVRKIGPAGTESQKYEQAAQLLQVLGPNLNSPARAVVGENIPEWLANVATQVGSKPVDLADPKNMRTFTNYLQRSKR